MRVEDIYLSKLDRFKSVLENNVEKCGTSDVFQNMLSAVTQRMNATSGQSMSTDLTPVYQQDTGIKSGSTSAEINAAIADAASSTGLDPNLIRAVIQTESSFRVDAVSGAGAQGLMQLMPGTAGELGVTDPFDAYQNVNGGAAYLKRQINRFGDVRLALAAYNTGPARIASLGITDANDPGEYEKIAGGVRGYVDKVMAYYRQYSQ